MRRALETVRRIPGLLMAAGIVVIAIWEIAALARVRAQAPEDDDWQRAARAVEEGHRPGDLIVFAPGWVDPIGRRWLGQLMTVDDAARMDDARYGRVWEVAIRGARAHETRDAPAPAVDRTFGAVRVRLHERPAARVLWDTRARARLYEVDFAPRKCVRLPVGARAPVRTDLGSAQLGTRLVAYAGMADFRERKANQARARLSLLVDGAFVASIVLDDDDGWVRLPEVATTPRAATIAVEAQVEGDGKPASMIPCIAIEARQ